MPITPASRSSSSVSAATASKYAGVMSSPSTSATPFEASAASALARRSQCATSTFSAGCRSVTGTRPPLRFTSRLISASSLASVRYSLPFRVYSRVSSSRSRDFSLFTSSTMFRSLRRIELFVSCAVASAACRARISSIADGSDAGRTTTAPRRSGQIADARRKPKTSVAHQPKPRRVRSISADRRVSAVPRASAPIAHSRAPRGASSNERRVTSDEVSRSR